MWSRTDDERQTTRLSSGYGTSKGSATRYWSPSSGHGRHPEPIVHRRRTTGASRPAKKKSFFRRHWGKVIIGLILGLPPSFCHLGGNRAHLHLLQRPARRVCAEGCPQGIRLQDVGGHALHRYREGIPLRQFQLHHPQRFPGARHREAGRQEGGDPLRAAHQCAVSCFGDTEYFVARWTRFRSSRHHAGRACGANRDRRPVDDGGNLVGVFRARIFARDWRPADRPPARDRFPVEERVCVPPAR